MAERSLSESMEDMLVHALVFGDVVLRGPTFFALRRRGLAGRSISGFGRWLTRTGMDLAREIAMERAADQTLTPQILRDVEVTAGLIMTPDGLTLIAAMEDMAVNAAERAAERGAGCNVTCRCGR
jgi:hypothetical protein